MGRRKSKFKSKGTTDQARWDRELTESVAKRALLNDADYWVGFAFETHAQREVFLRALNWDQYMDGERLFVNGVDLARALDIYLPDVFLRNPRSLNSRLLQLAEPFEDP